MPHPGKEALRYRVLAVREFEANFHAAIEDYLTASKALDSAPEEPAGWKVMLRIGPEVHTAALKAAARTGTSLNKWAAARKPATRVRCATTADSPH